MITKRYLVFVLYKEDSICGRGPVDFVCDVIPLGIYKSRETAEKVKSASRWANCAVHEVDWEE